MLSSRSSLSQTGVSRSEQQHLPAYSDSPGARAQPRADMLPKAESPLLVPTLLRAVRIWSWNDTGRLYRPDDRQNPQQLPAQPGPGGLQGLLGSRDPQPGWAWPLTCSSFIPTSCSPFLSKRRMISPTRCRWTPSGLMATKVRSLTPPKAAGRGQRSEGGKETPPGLQPRVTGGSQALSRGDTGGSQDPAEEGREGPGRGPRARRARR